VLDTVKDVGERFHRKQALTKKAAFLLYNIIVLHPFVNVNKRTAYELVKLFLQLNGSEIDSDPGEAYQFLLDVASGKISAAEVDKWVTINLTELK
jgi:death-on-curing protein